MTEDVEQVAIERGMAAGCRKGRDTNCTADTVPCNESSFCFLHTYITTKNSAKGRKGIGLLFSPTFLTLTAYSDQFRKSQEVDQISD